MCIFSLPVQEVADTRIFVRRASPTSQFLIYSMQYQAETDLAMILPLPKAPATGEEAVTFIDLSSYPRFFEDMGKGFPAAFGLPISRSRASEAAPPLKVHDVGSFEASWVPTLSDFVRLDGRFRLPATVWDQLPQYATYGFAVFKLKAGAKSVHPLALEFQTREQHRLFFPTVHVHAGSVEPKAHFHHDLYCQSGAPGTGWEKSIGKASTFLKIDRSKGLLQPDQAVFRQPLTGLHPNQDLWAAG